MNEDFIGRGDVPAPDGASIFMQAHPMADRPSNNVQLSRAMLEAAIQKITASDNNLPEVCVLHPTDYKHYLRWCRIWEREDELKSNILLREAFEVGWQGRSRAPYSKVRMEAFWESFCNKVAMRQVIEEEEEVQDEGIEDG